MAVQKGNPEKAMLFLFPLITLSFFLLAVVLYYVIPMVVDKLQAM